MFYLVKVVFFVFGVLAMISAVQDAYAKYLERKNEKKEQERHQGEEKANNSLQQKEELLKNKIYLEKSSIKFLSRCCKVLKSKLMNPLSQAICLTVVQKTKGYSRTQEYSVKTST